MADNVPRLCDVLRSVLAKQNVPKAEHAPERSEERAQLVAARYAKARILFISILSIIDIKNYDKNLIIHNLVEYSIIPHSISIKTFEITFEFLYI